MQIDQKKSIAYATVVICALGYFVDIYDLILFSIVRMPSLKALGVSDDRLMANGVYLINMQMGGMLLGGLLWGILGDKKGRLSVLYGSILLYSLANCANAFVTTVQQYAILRLLAGIGLAGELGAAVTLVSEVLPKEKRGYGVAIVASIGILGAIFAAFVTEIFSWQMAYVVGGALGILLLIFRLKLQDSSLFSSMHSNTKISKGNFFLFFSSKERLKRYLSCIFIGAPNWFVIGVLVAFAPEITKELGATSVVMASKGIGWLYFGLSLGDLVSGFLSQYLKSRKKVVLLFLSCLPPLMLVYLNSHEHRAEFYYVIFFLLGIADGFWAVFVTTAAEQFGTNLRATAATTVPNFVRGMVVPLTLSVEALAPQLGLIKAVGCVGFVCFTLAYLALDSLSETYDRDLDYLEI